MEDPTPTEQIKWLVALLDSTTTELANEARRQEALHQDSDEARKTTGCARQAYNCAKALDKYNPLFDSPQRTTNTVRTPAIRGNNNIYEHQDTELEDDETEATDDTEDSSTEAATIHNIFANMPLALKLAVWDELKLPAVCKHYTPEPVGPLRVTPSSCTRSMAIPTWLPAIHCMTECVPWLCMNQSIFHRIAERFHKEELDRVKAHGCETGGCLYEEYYWNLTKFNEAGRDLQKNLYTLSSRIPVNPVPLKVRLAFFKKGEQRLDIRRILNGGIANLMKEDDLSWVKRALKRHWINRPRNNQS